MAKRCAKCQGANRDEASTCKWCQAPLEGACPLRPPPKKEASLADIQQRLEQGDVAKAAALDEEVATLRAWQSTRPTEPLPQPKWTATIVSATLVVPSLLIPLLGVRDGWKLALLLGGLVALFPIFLALFALEKARHGRRDTPEHAVRFMIECLQWRDWEGLKNSSASYEGTERRRAKLAEAWKAVFGESALNYGFDGAKIKEVRRVAGAMALVVMELRSRHLSAATAVTVLAGVIVSNIVTFTLRKLLVLRGQRWYFVDGSPDHRHDGALLERITRPAA